MPTVNTTGRFVGDWPKIGIRPAVDGRQHGVRESLDAQTRAMAERTADLIRSSLRYPDGTPVEVVIPEHNIGGVYEAASAPDVAVAIATGERRIYANLLLTIGVVAPDASPDPAASTNPSARPPEDR